jgi:GTP-binding protein
VSFRYSKTAGKDTRNSWLEFTKQYFLKRRVLVAVMLLVDASISPQRMDLECANWLAEALVSLQGLLV